MTVSRKEIEKQQRREYILDCAEKLFAEKGFDGVTVAEIAKASEFSVGSLYLFFESKDALIGQLLLDRLRMIGHVLKTQVESSEPADKKLEAMILNLTNLLIEHIDFFRVVMHEIKRNRMCIPSEGPSDELEKQHLKNMEYTTVVFSQAVKEGIVRDDIQPSYMVITLDSIMHTLLNQNLCCSEEVNLHEMRDEMIELYYGGILKKGRSRRKKGQ